MNTPRLKKNWPRRLLQWGSLAAIIVFVSGLARTLFPSMDAADPEALCPMGGLQALVTYGVRGSLPCSMSSLQIILGLCLAAAVILFSKLFCGYLCPVGTVEDLLGALRGKLGIKSVDIRRGSLCDALLRVVKYLLLFWIVYMTATASELFCKNLDPYYAVATGFKGEITLWMSIVSVSLVLVGGLFIGRFWCRYICPLGAVSNSLRFWVWMLCLGAAWYLAGKLGAALPWWVLLAAFCLAGYLLEILCGKSRLQVLHIVKDDALCNGCGLCNRNCPCCVNVAQCRGRVSDVDCTLCGECAALCPTKALKVGAGPKNAGGLWKYAPMAVALLLLCTGILIGRRTELPTISEEWNMENVDASSLRHFEMEPLRSVKCFGSSMAFKGKLEQIPGTHGVKTYVGRHRVNITYDPAVTTPEKIQEAIFVPTRFKVATPDLSKVTQVKKVTIHTESMPDRMDLNNFGLQLRLGDKEIYGVESEFGCPLIVHVYMNPEEKADAAWFKQMVEKKELAMPLPNGDVRRTPLNFKFVGLVPGEEILTVEEYLHHIFTPVRYEFAKAKEAYEGKAQFLYEMADANYEKPIVTRYLPMLGNYLSREEGVIGVSMELNEELVPSIRIRFAPPCTGERIWDLITRETWTIADKQGNLSEENAKIAFRKPGVVKPL